MAAPSREVREPGLGRVVGPHAVQPLDGLLRHRVREVEIVLVWYADRRVVLDQHRIELTALAAKEAPEIVKAKGIRPAVERACGPLHVVGRQVPLAETRGRVAVPLQSLGEWHAVLRQHCRVARERPGELADHPKPHRVMVPTRHESRSCGRAHRGHVKTVVAQSPVSQSLEDRGADRPAESARVSEA
jgi:hypothetical protein